MESTSENETSPEETTSTPTPGRKENIFESENTNSILTRIELKLNEITLQLVDLNARFPLLIQSPRRSSNNNNVVKLNVGGKLFMTTLSTITSEKGTFFSAMFSGHFNTLPNDEGEYFIDRSPKYFNIILDHLRQVDVRKAIEALSEADRSLFNQEVDFYQIRSLSQFLSSTSIQIICFEKSSNITWGYTGGMDALCFSCDRDVILSGFGIFAKYQGSYTCSISLLEIISDNKKIILEYSISFKNEDKAAPYYYIQLEGVAIKKDITYDIGILLAGPTSPCGSNRRTLVTEKGLTVSFTSSPRSKNRTNMMIGQFYCFLFNDTPKKSSIFRKI